MTLRGPVCVLDQGEVLGGAQLHALEVAGVLADRGWEIHVLASESVAPGYRRRVLEADGLELEIIPMPRVQPPGVGVVGRTLKAAREIRACLRKRNAALVVANTLRTQVAGTLAAASAGIPMVWIVHDFMFPPRLLPFLLPLVNRVVAVSEGVEQFVAGSAAGSRAGKVVVVPNGIDVIRVEGVRPAETVRDMAGDEFRFRAGERYVATLGHIHPRKGQDLFLRAAAELLQDPPPGAPVHFLVVGDVVTREAESESFLTELRGLCRRHGLGCRVTFLGWQDDVLAVLKRLELLVSASRVPEGFGRTVLEGFAAGVPVVAAALGEPARLIRHGDNGLLFEPDDHLSLAEAMRSVLGDSALAARLAAGGRRTVGEDLSLEAVASRMEEVWLETLGPRS